VSDAPAAALRRAMGETVSAAGRLRDRVEADLPGAPVPAMLAERVSALADELGWELGLPPGEPATPRARLDHVGIVVRDLRAAAVLWGDLLGGEIVAGGVHGGLGVRTLHYAYAGGGKVELLAPVGAGGPIAAYLADRGEGMHHLTFVVADLDGTVGALERHALRVVDASSTPDGWREAYVSPRSAQGCVVQLVAGEAGLEPVDGVTLDDVLAGRWEWADHRPRRV
jgi:methylmalonyl-CoA/ethylmalonyl-CoA epimerase